MSAQVEQAANNPAVPVKNEIKSDNPAIVGFDAERFRAPFVLRCGAICIDYLLLASAPVLGLLIAQSSGDTGAKMMKSQAITLGWLIALLVVVTNFVVLPAILGRTIGKFMTGLQIVQKDGRNLTFVSAMLRHLVGYPVSLLTAGIGFLLAAFNQKGKALHDFIAGTIVVQAKRRMVVNRR
jgi:uncharacterized RDD family membrane protein YckC